MQPRSRFDCSIGNLNHTEIDSDSRSERQGRWITIATHLARPSASERLLQSDVKPTAGREPQYFGGAKVDRVLPGF
jgi:hypothetical protein